MIYLVAPPTPGRTPPSAAIDQSDKEYTSGCMHDMIDRHGVFEPGTAFLQKPFTARALARTVRDVLTGA